MEERGRETARERERDRDREIERDREREKERENRMKRKYEIYIHKNRHVGRQTGSVLHRDREKSYCNCPINELLNLSVKK